MIRFARDCMSKNAVNRISRTEFQPALRILIYLNILGVQQHMMARLQYSAEAKSVSI